MEVAGDVNVSGNSGSQQHRAILPFTQASASTAFIPNIWARLRIAELADRKAWEHDPYDELGAAIKATALKYQLVSDYTSFVAVDASHRTAGDRSPFLQDSSESGGRSRSSPDRAQHSMDRAQNSIDWAQSTTKCFRLEDVDRAVDGLQVQLRTAVTEQARNRAA